MALDHTIMLPLKTTGPAPGTVLKVQAGGHTSVATDQDVQNNHTSFQNVVKWPFVWNGNAYFWLGSGPSVSSGVWKYNHAVNKLEMSSFAPLTFLLVPIFDRIGFIGSADQGWGLSPEDRRDRVAIYSGFNLVDRAISGGNVEFIDSITNRLFGWSYPFTSAPALGATLPDVSCRCLCEYGGDIYTAWVDDAGGFIKLYKLSGGVLSLVGTGSAHAGLTSYDPSTANGQILFKFNGKINLIVSRQGAGTPMFRHFEIDPVTGASTEPGYLPAAWTGAGSGQQKIMYVPDSISPTEQVFLIHYEYGLAGWDCYEFLQSAMGAAEDSGSEVILGGGGVIYDPTAKSAQIKSAADSSPSSYVREVIEVFDLAGNGAVDIDPRYRWNNAEPPPYAQCTGKVPNDTVLALPSTPGFTVLSDLDDDFADGVINDELWERVSFCFLDDLRDYGHGNATYMDMAVPAEEANGAMRFGDDAGPYEIDQGVGVKSKSRMAGVFIADFTLADPENLRVQSTTPYFMNIVLVRESVNTGYGFIVWKSSTGPQVYVRGIYMFADGNIVVSSDVAAADGDVIRIERNAGSIWTITFDPNGVTTGPTDITPVGGALSANVEIVMAGKSNTAVSWVAAATPSGDEPGISDLAITGGGVPTLYQSGVKHTFDWDHITDLGAGQIGGAELFVDTQRT